MSAIVCKFCNQKIKTPPEAMVVGIPKERRLGIITQALGVHLQTEAAREAKGLQSIAPQNGKPNPAIVLPKSLHFDAIQQVMLHGNAIQGFMMLNCFELTDELAEIHEINRAVIHAWSRKVKLTDEDLSAKALQLANTDKPEVAAMFMLQDLRDRYEEIGKYAPISAVPPAPDHESKPSLEK